MIVFGRDRRQGAGCHGGKKHNKLMMEPWAFMVKCGLHANQDVTSACFDSMSANAMRFALLVPTMVNPVVNARRISD